MNTKSPILRDKRFGQPVTGPECLIEEVRAVNMIELPQEAIEIAFMHEVPEGERGNFSEFLSSDEGPKHFFAGYTEIVRIPMGSSGKSKHFLLKIRDCHVVGQELEKDPWPVTQKIRKGFAITAEPLVEFRLHLPLRHKLKMDWLLDHLPGLLEKTGNVLKEVNGSDVAKLYHALTHPLLSGGYVHCGEAAGTGVSFSLVECHQWYPLGPDILSSGKYADGMFSFKKTGRMGAILSHEEAVVREVALRIARYYLEMTD